ncbi:Mitochondrial import inner membrane translocase subunit Tim29 [Schistosoma japonicum]|nr:Mitochondrial import inner membrane translocase subunit Tim29 [Schistosoma japonicum]
MHLCPPMSSATNLLKQTIVTNGSRINLNIKLQTYFRQLIEDYVSSGRDALQLVRQNPLRSALWASVIVGISYIARTCPNKQDYYASLIQSAIDLWEVPDLIRNSQSTRYIHKCLKLSTKEQIRYSSLGLFTIIWRDDRTQSCCQYAEVCKYTHPANGGGNFGGFIRLFLFDRPQENGWQRIHNIVHNRILDLGFMGRWWFMSHYMENYDINFDEWETPNSLPTLPEKSSTDVSFKNIEKSSQSTFLSSHSKPFGDGNYTEQNLELHLSNPNSVSDDWEIVSEEVLYVDCQGLLEDDILTPNSVIRLVDIESAKPLMQVGPAVFEGHYEDTVGTYLFFENNSPTFNTTLFKETVSAASVRKVDDQTPQHTTSYFTKSSKSLTFQQTYFRQLIEDYVSSGRDALQLVRQNPLRSALWASVIVGISYIARTCPNKQDYYASLIQSAIDLWEVPDLIRNSQSTRYIHKCLKLSTKEQIRYSSLGLFTIIWRDDRTQSCCQYAEVCKYTHPANGGGNFGGFIRLFLFDRPQENGWQRIHNIVHNRILDLGFMGRWWFMSHYMENYDINFDEWETPNSLPTLPEKSSTDVSFKNIEKSSQSTFLSSHSKPFGDGNYTEQNLELHLSNPNSVSDDWEIVSEEVLYVDCQGLLEDDILTPNSVIRLVDIESAKPLMQVGPAVFEGHYEDTVGTYLFFENNSPTFNTTLFKETVSAASVRKVDDQTPQHTTSYFTKSSKSLTFQRIFLKAKENH